MSTPEDLAKYIEFHLDRLGERNQHHEFEHVCRRVAAARIASNILPATGPVSGGGDQGRDFETHPTAIAQEVRSAPPGSWSALAAQERIAFCATTQRSKLRSKIEDDVDSIMAEGERPDRVHAFTAGAMTKAERAKAIRAVREKHEGRPGREAWSASGACELGHHSPSQPGAAIHPPPPSRTRLGAARCLAWGVDAR